MANNRATTFSFLKSGCPWLVVFCGMLFYCFNYFLRSAPGFMQSELSQSFHITASQWGLLGSAYYWGYVPMQIPAGLLYDKLGVRFVLCVATLLATLGLSVFISADTFLMAWVGRFLIGLGCAFAYIGTLKLASVWLAPNRLALVAGLATAMGMSFGALTQLYVSHAVRTMPWHVVLHPGLLAGVMLSIIILLFVQDKNSNQSNFSNEMQAPITTKQLFQALYTIIKNPQMWLIGAIGCLLYLPASVLQDSFLKEFLATVYHLTPYQAATVSMLTSGGWIISGPIIGAYSDKIKRRCLPLTITGLFAAALLCIPFFIPNLLSTLSALYLLFFIAGFCCGAHPLCFPLGKENNPIQISGTAIAFTNMLIMLGGMIVPPIVGRLLDMHSTTFGANGLPSYSASDYTFALSVIPLGVALGIFLSIFLKETYCESRARKEDELIFSVNSIQFNPKAETVK